MSVIAQAATPAIEPDYAAETKHEKFQRLARARVIRAMEDIRLVSQLSGRTYEHKPSEVELIVTTLSNSVYEMAKAFSVPYASKVGKAGKIDPTIDIFHDPKAPVLAETSKAKIIIAKALDALKSGNADKARELLIELL